MVDRLLRVHIQSQRAFGPRWTLSYNKTTSPGHDTGRQAACGGTEEGDFPSSARCVRSVVSAIAHVRPHPRSHAPRHPPRAPTPRRRGLAHVREAGSSARRATHEKDNVVGRTCHKVEGMCVWHHVQPKRSVL